MTNAGKVMIKIHKLNGCLTSKQHCAYCAKKNLEFSAGNIIAEVVVPWFAANARQTRCTCMATKIRRCVFAKLALSPEARDRKRLRSGVYSYLRGTQADTER